MALAGRTKASAPPYAGAKGEGRQSFSRILGLGVQDAARPRRGPSPPERFSKSKVLTNLLFARCSGPRV